MKFDRYANLESNETSLTEDSVLELVFCGLVLIIRGELSKQNVFTWWLTTASHLQNAKLNFTHQVVILKYTKPGYTFWIHIKMKTIIFHNQQAL